MPCDGRSADPSQRLATPCDMKTLSQNRAIAISHLSLVFLSLASGCTDVLSFLKLGNVFTSAMTGNTALLAIALGQGQVVCCHALADGAHRLHQRDCSGHGPERCPARSCGWARGLQPCPSA